jgi:hypothetical protein
LVPSIGAAKMRAGIRRKLVIRLAPMIALGILSALALGAWVSHGATVSIADVIWTIGGGGH